MRALVSCPAHNANPVRETLQDYEFYRQVLGVARYIRRRTNSTSERLSSMMMTPLSADCVEALRILSRRYRV